MRVVYVDTGMVGEVGHHHVCGLITRALRERGHDVTVASWLGLQDAARRIPSHDWVPP